MLCPRALIWLGASRSDKRANLAELQSTDVVTIFKNARESASAWVSIETDFKNIKHETMHKYDHHQKDEVSEFREQWVKLKQEHSYNLIQRLV